MEHSSLANDIHTKRRDASEKTDLDMQWLLATNKAFQTIQGELANNALKLTKIDDLRKKDSKK